MNPSFLPAAIVGQGGLFNLGLGIDLVQEKLNLNQLYSALKLALCHIPPMAEGLDKFILIIWREDGLYQVTPFLP